MDIEERVRHLEKQWTELNQWRHEVLESSREALQNIATMPYPNLFKVSATSMWPAFATRNLISGQIRNFMDGTFSLTHREEVAVQLRVPMSGTHWIDEMIRESRSLDGRPQDVQKDHD